MYAVSFVTVIKKNVHFVFNYNSGIIRVFYDYYTNGNRVEYFVVKFT